MTIIKITVAINLTRKAKIRYKGKGSYTIPGKLYMISSHHVQAGFQVLETAICVIRYHVIYNSPRLGGLRVGVQLE